MTGDASSRPTCRIEGTEPVVLPWDVDPDALEFDVVRGPIGFECASGDWIESEWTGVPVLDLVEAADPPPETTHVQFVSADGGRACVPLVDLDGAIVALGEGPGTKSSRPRFVSPHVLGPRTVKNLRTVRPMQLDPGSDRETYESLPIDE